MTYRTLDGDTVIASAVAEHDWWASSAATPADELTQAGAGAVHIDDDLVIARAPASEGLHRQPT